MQSSLTPRGELISVSPSPIKTVLDEEKRRIVYEALEKALTKSERRVIILTYWEGMSTEDIANFMRTTPQATKQCRYRAIKKLRNYPKLMNYLSS